MWNWVCVDAHTDDNLGGIEGSNQAQSHSKKKGYILLDWSSEIGSFFTTHLTSPGTLVWCATVTVTQMKRETCVFPTSHVTKWLQKTILCPDTTHDCSCKHITLALPVTLITCWSAKPLCALVLRFHVAALATRSSLIKRLHCGDLVP